MRTYKGNLPEVSLKYKNGTQKKVKITKSKDAEKILRKMYDSDTLEYLESSIVIFLNRANNTIGWLKISQGGMSSTIIDKKVLFAAALNCGASSILLSHNHPSGNTKPSMADIKMTKSINEACKIMDISFLDHIIIGGDEYLSMKDESYF